MLMKEAQSAKQKNFIFFLISYCHCIVDGCWYLLLSDKISSKTKTFITILQHKERIKRNYVLVI